MYITISLYKSFAQIDMQTPTRSNRARLGGYSDFFSSGFRAITSRNTSTSSRPRPLSTNSLPVMLMSSSRRSSEDSGKRGRPQSPKFTSDSKQTSSSAEKQRKRSSFMEFSAKLFDKITPGVPEARSFVEFDETRRRLRPQLRDSSSDWSKTIAGPQVSSIRTIRTQYVHLIHLSYSNIQSF